MRLSWQNDSPEDMSVRFSYLPTLHALFALSQNGPSRALEELQPALPHDLAFPGTAFFAKFGALGADLIFRAPTRIAVGKSPSHRKRNRRLFQTQQPSTGYCGIFRLPKGLVHRSWGISLLW